MLKFLGLRQPRARAKFRLRVLKCDKRTLLWHGVANNSTIVMS